MECPEFKKDVFRLAAKYGCQDIVEYNDCEDPEDRDCVIFPNITVRLGRFRIDIDIDKRWGGVLRFDFSVTFFSKKYNEEDSRGMVFPKKYYPFYLPREVKPHNFFYHIPVTYENWNEKMISLLEAILKNRKALERDCEKSCLRDENGNSKRHWEEWRSDAKILEIENHNNGGIIQGITQKHQVNYDCFPGCVGSNGTYRVFGNNEWVLSYRIKYRAQGEPCPLFPIVSIEKFMKEKLMPSLGYKRVSPQLKQRILEHLQSQKLVVVTRDFGEDGFVDENAEFIPVGFSSWDAYYEDVFKDWLK